MRRRAPGDNTVVLEGPRTLSEALAAGIEPSVVVTAESVIDSPPVADVLDRLAAGVELLALTDQAFRSVAPAMSPQPVLALVDKPRAVMPGSLAYDDLVLVLVGVSDPGNTGTIIRTAEACSSRCVVVVGGADPWAPKTVRASAGSVLRVPVVLAEDAAVALEALRAAGAMIVAADSSEGEPHDSGMLAGGRGPVALVLGSESHGLQRSIYELVDYRVRIPMAGDIESLNVAMAATLLAFEYRRRP
ncbi:MAG: RNA methyltransferase [Acidimicrobiaceae bacterium]|nr:RNA methyltransferase [Acidimicrobiaceae bacterium]MDE0494353.1 RNA methyltransferase [Acidimicrobiaceae bacterium]MDE0655099.1 RNA methyltransferase [Acidimicrobiaceae bacterium]MXZ95639.1 RNA methyltransferase [Acidimicrobiaceae bacterium]MYF42504.1 RNA methyltransferase [Acidimicrobiaceae bacterium]